MSAEIDRLRDQVKIWKDNNKINCERVVKLERKLRIEGANSDAITEHRDEMVTRAEVAEAKLARVRKIVDREEPHDRVPAWERCQLIRVELDGEG